jgi:alkylhydroperoxidase family enzyme
VCSSDLLVFGNHVLSKSTLPAREREVLILRVGWKCRAEYEFGQHTVIGRSSGLSDEEIARITEGPDAEGWSELDRLLLRAADELLDDAFLSEATWQALTECYETKQVMDLIFTVGQYNMVSMALNSLGVQLEAGAVGFPAS